MSRFHLAMLAVAAILAVGNAAASDLPVPNNYNHVEYKRYGNNYSWTPLNGATPNSGSVSFPSRTTISTVEPKINTQVRLPFDTRTNVPESQMAKVATAINKPAFAKAALDFAKRMSPIGAAVTVLELIDFFKDMGLENIHNTPNGITGVGSGGGGGQGINAYQYNIRELASQWRDSPEEACSNAFQYELSHRPGDVALMGYYIASNGSCVVTHSNRDTWFYNVMRRNNPACPEDATVSDGVCKPAESGPGQGPMTEQQVHDMIAENSGWPTSAAILAQKMLNEGQNIEVGTPEVSGPSSIPGNTTTSTEPVQLNPGTNTPAAPGATNTQPGTKTTVKETKTDVKYSGNSASTNTTTNTTTNITNNITNVTTTETKTETTEDQKEDDSAPSDTPLGDIPELYKLKYPQGISGVLNARFDEMKATPVFSLPSLLMPSLPNSGTCPSWTVDLSLVSWAQMGTHRIEAPCEVWYFGRIVIIISALLLARRLIFGG